MMPPPRRFVRGRTTPANSETYDRDAVLRAHRRQVGRILAAESGRDMPAAAYERLWIEVCEATHANITTKSEAQKQLPPAHVRKKSPSRRASAAENAQPQTEKTQYVRRKSR